MNLLPAQCFLRDWKVDQRDNNWRKRKQTEDCVLAVWWIRLSLSFSLFNDGKDDNVNLHKMGRWYAFAALSSALICRGTVSRTCSLLSLAGGLVMLHKSREMIYFCGTNRRHNPTMAEVCWRWMSSPDLLRRSCCLLGFFACKVSSVFLLV